MEKAEVRLLTANDAAEYRRVRLQALSEHPEAFGSSAEDFAVQTLESLGERLANQTERFTLFGAFDRAELVGLVGFGRDGGLKVRHRGGIYQMYVTPGQRGRGVGRLLLEYAVEYARSLPGLEEVNLAVTVGNDPARRLYERFGFVYSHREPRYIKFDGRYYDIDWMTLKLQ